MNVNFGISNLFLLHGVNKVSNEVESITFN